ncbi:MAG: hypothetical protein KGR46_00960 [Verrucomicrobia bacterium]|nr:hypothetical protein [Verrucomicrobiota bacterium]
MSKITTAKIVDSMIQSPRDIRILMKRTAVLLLLSLVLFPLQISFADNLNAGSKTFPESPCNFIEEPDLNSILGKWRWFDAQVVFFYADGTFIATGSSREKSTRYGTWKKEAHRKFTLLWDNGAWEDVLTLSSNGNGLRGRNNNRDRISAERIQD